MNLTKTYFIAALLMLASALTIQSARAERVEPTGRDTPVTATFDKSSPPSQIDIWKDESGGYDTDKDSLWGRNTWICLSSSNPVNGQCSTNVTGVVSGKTSIPILLTEQRSHTTAIINLTAFHYLTSDIGTSCWPAGNLWGPYLVNAGMEVSCSDGNKTDNSLLNVNISANELKKLPVGGIWKAELKMSLMQWDPRIKLADWNAHITLNVTDNNNQQIYLPEFGQAAPRVDLNMRPLPGTGGNQTQMKGAANIDMCLYDGYGSNSSSFTVKFDDQPQGSLSRNEDDFSVYADGGDASQVSDRIDYQVAMQLPNANTLKVIRGQDNVISDIATARVRPVHLPGIPQAVLCVPTPLTLSTQNMNINSKRAGHYTGHLIVDFTPQL